MYTLEYEVQPLRRKKKNGKTKRVVVEFESIREAIFAWAQLRGLIVHSKELPISLINLYLSGQKWIPNKFDKLIETHGVFEDGRFIPLL